MGLTNSVLHCSDSQTQEKIPDVLRFAILVPVAGRRQSSHRNDTILDLDLKVHEVATLSR